MKILVVEDENALREVIVRSLEKERYVVESASSFREASLKINDYDYDCIVLDIMLPGGSGLTLLKELRALRKKDSIIIISAKDSIEDKVTGLDLGADDYLTKPIGTSELLARIRTALRHSNRLNTDSPLYKRPFHARDLTIDFEKHLVTLGEKEIHLTQIEFKIISLLAKNSGRVMTYDAIISNIWGPYADDDNSILRVNMAHIRRKLEQNPAEPQYIFTEIGIGYRMVEDEAGN